MIVDDICSRGGTFYYSAKALGAFDFRGEECTDSAVKAGAGWCLSFLNTATVPTIPYLEQNYACDCTKEAVAFGSPSTEHSVMCSNYAVDGDEVTLLKRLLNEIHPNTSFSVVLDSYDYWNIIDHVLPQIKDDIMAHNGCMLMRGDSGDCVEVVTKTNDEYQFTDGYTWKQAYESENELVPVFKDGILVKEQSLREIRDRLHDNQF